MSFIIILQLLFKQENIALKYLIPFLLKIDKFKEVKEEQFQNIPHILLTLLVLKLDKFKEIKEEQS